MRGLSTANAVDDSGVSRCLWIALKRFLNSSELRTFLGIAS